MIERESLAGNCLWMQFQLLDYGWMTSRSTKSLEGSDSYQKVNCCDLCAE